MTEYHMVRDERTDRFLLTYMTGRTTDKMSQAMNEVLQIMADLTGELPDRASEDDDNPQRFSMNLNAHQLAALSTAAGLGNAFGEMMIRSTPNHPANSKDAGDAPKI